METNYKKALREKAESDGKLGLFQDRYNFYKDRVVKRSMDKVKAAISIVSNSKLHQRDKDRLLSEIKKQIK